MSKGGELRHELERVISERDRLLAESSELGADKATRESERAALRAELREARQREQRLLLDIGDLEDENISLQKQVSALRSSQVEFEGLKHEVRQLREEAENARAAAEEMAALRRIAERQLAEALEALQAEREAKFAAKKELDAHLSREAAYNITNLAYSIRGMPDDGDEEGEAGGSGSAELAVDHHADLFSEVHLHEISRLEKQLEQAHNENGQLSSSLRTAQTTAETESAAATALRTGLVRLASRLSALRHLHGECGPLDEEKSEGGVSARAAKWLTWWRVSGGEVGALSDSLAELMAAQIAADASPAALQRQALAQLSDRVAEAELRCSALQAEAELMRTIAGGAGRALASAAPALTSAAETLAQLYHHVCAVNGTQPERLLLEHAHQTDGPNAEGRGVDEEALALAAGELEGLRAAGSVARYADTLLDQLTHLRAALDTALDSRHRHQPDPTPCHFSLRTKSHDTIKQNEDRLNAKLRFVETRQKFNDLLSELNSHETKQSRSDNICEGKTVKEIAHHFERISQYESYVQMRDTESLSRENVPYECRISPFVFARKCEVRCDVNLHAVWRRASAHGRGSSSKRAALQRKSQRRNYSLRDSLRSGFVACVPLLQYVI
ncbi:protein bicaudal D isoform X3 [Pieris brassicae]|uniref:protein bicaudal D isoform X3 n=1 Tax=Pieris brassicae TaxID=7116 RepID=UPI001E661BA4|nr:protein bicaudal D isoform X3 [Pieris brassicae]